MGYILLIRFIYPTMEELGDQLVDVMVHFNLRKFIGFGVGVGANIIVRFALTHPDKVTIKNLRLNSIRPSEAGKQTRL